MFESAMAAKKVKNSQLSVFGSLALGAYIPISGLLSIDSS
jgi:hypothetical protein